MRVIDLDGDYCNWNITGYSPKNNDKRPRSSLHIRARNIIKDLFTTSKVLEEVPIKLRRTQTLYLDFYLPLQKLCIEVHGEQHYKFIPFYHQNMLSFAKALKKDKEKVEWCQINNIEVVELPFNEKDDDWKRRIQDR